MKKTLKTPGFIFIILCFTLSVKAQQDNCTFKEAQITINFGAGDAADVNTGGLYNYRRVGTSCPSDGYYSFASYTRSCFGDDWHTLTEDHTAGDNEGNMLLVNGAPRGGVFLRTQVTGLKANTIYELGMYVMNLCKPTEKCPFPLLPDLSIRLENPDGSRVASFATGQLTRVSQPRWTRYTALFTTPSSSQTLTLVMMNHVPGGCGNDFTVDDIAFRECVVQVTKAPKSKPVSKPAATQKTTTKKIAPTSQGKVETVASKPKRDTFSRPAPVVRSIPKITIPPPLILKTRENALVSRIEAEEGEIRIEIYDNGEIDGDTISVYHNNELIRSHQRLSQKPVTITIGINPSQSHHEIIMVAENLGSIPPNTSVMIIKTARTRHELMITSSEQKNAKVEFNLKK